MKRLLLLTLALGFALANGVAGCAASGGSDDEPWRVPIGGDAGLTDGANGCTAPEEGCACDESPPLDCYLEPTFTGDGTLTCHVGTRYCRDGRWTACESVQDFAFTGDSSALITGPSACNPCDPRCFITRTTPTTPDLMGRSDDVEYDPREGGIRIVDTRMGGMVGMIDSDRDGVPDVADGCIGPGVAPRPDGSCDGDFIYRSLPNGSPGVTASLSINTTLRTADVYFLMDTTGSMGGELGRLRTDLTSGTFIAGCAGGIIGAVRCTIPDAWFGVGYHDDYPWCSSASQCYGSAASGDRVFRHVLDITSSVAAAQAAVSGLTLHFGEDGPESQVPALWAIATGSALGTYYTGRTGCAGGGWGAPCFRAATIPIVVHITDAPYHNGPSNAYPYCLGTYSTRAAPAASIATVTGNETYATARHVGDVFGAWVGYSGTTTGTANDIAAGCGAGAGEVVYRFTLSARQYTTISLEGSSYDTVLRVQNVATGAAWCNDDAVGLQSRLELDLPAGDYYVVVDGYGGSTGNYRVTIGDRYPCSAAHTPPTFGAAAAALRARGVQVITVQTCGFWSDSYCLEGEAHAVAMGNASGSIGSTGSPYVIRANADGSGLSATIVNAIRDLANYNRMDVSARAVGDIWGFTQSITAVRYRPGTACTGISGGTTFIQCLPGSDLDFDVRLFNPGLPTGVYTYTIQIIGDGTIVLDEIAVRIIVPGPTTRYEPEGRYWQDYDSTLRCSIGERPDWGMLNWTANIPAGTALRWELRAAETLAALPTATPVATFTTTTSGPGSLDIAPALAAAGIDLWQHYLRVTAVLVASADLLYSPTLNDMSVAYTCIPQE